MKSSRLSSNQELRAHFCESWCYDQLSRQCGWDEQARNRSHFCSQFLEKGTVKVRQFKKMRKLKGEKIERFKKLEFQVQFNFLFAIQVRPNWRWLRWVLQRMFCVHRGETIWRFELHEMGWPTSVLQRLQLLQGSFLVLWPVVLRRYQQLWKSHLGTEDLVLAIFGSLLLLPNVWSDRSMDRRERSRK